MLNIDICLYFVTPPLTIPHVWPSCKTASTSGKSRVYVVAVSRPKYKVYQNCFILIMIMRTCVESELMHYITPPGTIILTTDKAVFVHYMKVGR